MDKEKKITIKLLHEFMSDRYKTAVDSYLNNYLTSDDIELYIDNEKSIASRIATLRDDLKNNELAQKYRDVTTGELSVDKYIRELEDELEILQAEYQKLIKTDSFTPAQAKVKREKFKNLDDRIAFTTKLINDLKMSKEAYRPKRKPGRPKKK